MSVGGHHKLNAVVRCLLFLLLVFLPVTALAVDAVTPLDFSVVPVHEALVIHAPFQDDSNGNSTLKISWATSGTDWLDASVQDVDLVHQGAEFVYEINGLSNFTKYQVRIEFSDDDGVTNGLGIQVIAEATPYNKLVHSSYTTGSLKWSAQGGWGIPDAKYGEFTCQTCHARNSGNIKRVKKEIVVTDVASFDTFPVQDASGSVDFLSTKPGQSDFGDDERVPATESSFVCEVCHSQNKYHNYNSVTNTGGTSHYNREDCTSCHAHKNAFKPGCGGCHPEEPTMASHDEHLISAMLAVDFGCQTCHDTSVHRNALSEVRFDAGEPAVSGASYSEEGGDETSCYDELDGYCGTPTYGTCDNLYCHSNADPRAGTNIYRQPTWGGAAMACDSCHDTGGALTGLSTRHDIHTDSGTYDFSCVKCHSATAYNSTTINDAAQHIDVEKDVVFAAGGVYNTALVCSGTYCHSDGAGNEGNISVRWTDSGSLGCVGCHNGRIGDQLAGVDRQMESNAHLRLANEQWIRKYPCEHCHNDTVNLAGDIISHDKHVNEQIDIVFNTKWNIDNYPVASYNATTMVCNNIYCHSDGTKTPKIRDFPWDLDQHAKCDSCHGHEPGDDCSECHPGEVPEVTPENQWKMATPMYENTGEGTDRANSHLRHLEIEFACENCHYDTVVGSCNTAGCHDGGVPDGEMSEVGHVFADFHVNTIKDVSFKGNGEWIRETRTCKNTDCHSGVDPKWGESHNDVILCKACHSGPEADVDDYGGFNGIQARINWDEWETSGHGRQTASGPYTSGNPPANFPGNPCWYCHDKEVLHKDITNPYRLIAHPQFEKRFEKECVYCHMEQKDEECRGCHDSSSSLSPQLVDIDGTYTEDHSAMTGFDGGGNPIPPVDNRSCMDTACHMPQIDKAGGESDRPCFNCHDPGSLGNGPKLDDEAVRYGMANEPYKISEIRVGMSTAPYAVDHIEFNGVNGAYKNVSCMATPEEWPPTGCHSPDAHIHNTNSDVWTSAQKADVKNQYIMMGVCLQCHDDANDGRCNSCHTWEGVPEDNPYTLGYDPGTGFNTGSSHASSSHFGFKHFQAYEDSLSNIVGSGQITEVFKVDDKLETTRLTDTTQAWAIKDELVGKSIEIGSELRSVLTNSYNTVTVSGFYSINSATLPTYNVVGTVWKGGKFCWDCHDPHGDSNIYMIHDEVATETDGLFGKPLARAQVTFTRTLDGMDYAQSGIDNDGICNVCHTNVDHYHYNFGDDHRSERRCTDCHEHGFAAGHGSGQSCEDCHDKKPLPNHLGFGQPRDCTKCHDGVVNNRMDIMRQFRGQSHHVQGIEVTNDHCYECHWESTKYGLINNDYHAGYNYKTHDAVLNARSDLVVWTSTERPERFELDTTAVIFNATTIGTVNEREQVTDVTTHCLGCHSDINNTTDIFGDCKTPNQYAWDGTSIAARYNQTGVTTFGKYAGTNIADKNQQKAFSAHGKATLNQGGWDAATGEDGNLGAINTRGGGQNVQCYDCHSSHGSFTTGITSSYRTFDGGYNGANLKETQAGRGGYSVTYKAGDETNAASFLNPGAAQCFDCHETRLSGSMPWGYFDTFGADEPIQGYRDSSRFDGVNNGIKVRAPFRAAKVGVSGHYSHISSDLTPAPDQQINGLCSGCHDPHGVSPTLGSNQQYAVPLLKGTWLTSPYKEDMPQPDTRLYDQPAGTRPRIASSEVHIDRKTFSDLTNRTHITEDVDQFAGLCMRCHLKDDLTDDYDPEVGTKPTWKSMKRVHQSVKGWGSNNEHQFPCSKCHQPHSSGLEKLMRTNCLDWKHRGGVEADGPQPNLGRYRSDTEHFPRLRNIYPTPCHQSAGAAGGVENSGNFLLQEWNEVTPW